MDAMQRLMAARERGRSDAADGYREASRGRLLGSVTTRLRTTMIGSLSAFEESFGFLRGQGECPAFVTDAERAVLERMAGRFDDLWEGVRTRVLNLGNGQIRAVQSEASQYEVSWNRHQYDLADPADVRRVAGLRDDGSPRRDTTRKD